MNLNAVAKDYARENQTGTVQLVAAMAESASG